MFDTWKLPFFKRAHKMADFLQILSQCLKIALLMPPLIGFRCCRIRIRRYFCDHVVRWNFNDNTSKKHTNYAQKWEKTPCLNSETTVWVLEIDCDVHFVLWCCIWLDQPYRQAISYLSILNIIFRYWKSVTGSYCKMLSIRSKYIL